MDTVIALTLLERLLDEIPRLKRLHYKNQEFEAWDQRVREILKEAFGVNSSEYARYNGVILLKYAHTEEDKQEAYIDHLNQRVAALKSIIEKHEMIAGDTTHDTVIETPKAFIAHGGKSEALEKIKEFLRALGVEPLVVEEQPSEGREKEQQVTKYFKEADCEIVLATYGDIVDQKTGAKHPRLNVVDELARGRERFPNKVILLLERGVSLPSNVSGVVYGEFTQDNMEAAFIKVAKELRAFGILRAQKPGGNADV